MAYGPLWDFDRGMGPDEDDRAADPTKWMADEAYFWVTQYWSKMFDDPNFEQRWVDRWQELRQTVFSDANLRATLAEPYFTAYRRPRPETLPDGEVALLPTAAPWPIRG